MDLQSLSKPYFKIQPDYEGCLGYFSKDNCCYGCDDDTLELDGFESTPFVIPGIEEWCWEWDKENHFIKDHFLDGMKSDFDWADWQKRGLDFAQRLRQIAPDEIEIAYGNDVLDKIRYFYFSADTCCVVGDTNECSEIYEDDVLEVAHFLPIHLPGLDKWWKEFDCHVDYADSTADPDFDWATWYFKGLEMVKLIRANLPLSVEVWYRIPFELRKVFPVPDLFVKEDGTFLIRDFLKRDK